VAATDTITNDEVSVAGNNIPPKGRRGERERWVLVTGVEWVLVSKVEKVLCTTKAIGGGSMHRLSLLRVQDIVQQPSQASVRSEVDLCPLLLIKLTLYLHT
jgi:hypothetical protein